MGIDVYKYYIVQPAAGENYIKNPQPSVATTGYGASDSAIALDDTYTRRGPQCIKVTPQANKASGIYYSPVSIASGTSYVFSVDVRGVVGQAMRILISDHTDKAVATKTFTATGKWQRIEVAYTADYTETTSYVAVIRDTVASTSAFWVDGFQLETGVTKATTWIYGYERGLGYIDDYKEYGWRNSDCRNLIIKPAA